MCATSAKVSLAVHAGNATPYVPRRQYPASVARCESAARPRDDFRRPSAQSDRETANRCVVVLDVVNAATSADQIHGNASVGRWLAEQPAVRFATAATPCARTATADGQLCETADSSAPGWPTGVAGQALRAADRACDSPILQRRSESHAQVGFCQGRSAICCGGPGDSD